MSDLARLTGKQLEEPLSSIRQLLSTGETSASSLASLRGEALGLWRLSAGRTRAIMTPALVQLVRALPHLSEAVGAVLCCDASLRAAWCRIVASYLKELGGRRDATNLIEAIDTLKGAASEVCGMLSSSSSSQTSFIELERHSIHTPAHEAKAIPVLLRVLGATASLLSGSPAPSLPEIELSNPNPAQWWVSGRVLLWPSEGLLQEALRGVLAGRISGATNEDSMNWVLHHPWAFLLAQVVFMQEAWLAERVSGCLTLELEESHLSVFHAPPQVLITVTLPSGEEVRCGTLGELLLRTLAELGVSVLAGEVSAYRLDDALSSVITRMLQKEVWRFEHGSSGRPSSYLIHAKFSDSCYRALGSRVFYRLGSRVTGAIRSAAERWAKERLSRAASVAPSSGAFA
jgi:hypothetical protein